MALATGTRLGPYEILVRPESGPADSSEAAIGIPTPSANPQNDYELPMFGDVVNDPVAVRMELDPVPVPGATHLHDVGREWILLQVPG